MKRLVFFDSDPSYACIRIMIPNDAGEFSPLPDTASDVREVDETEIPTDRTFRDAWTVIDGKIDVDLAKARGIHREKLRALRKPLLDALDVEYQRADEAGDTEAKKAVAAKKQALRDVTKDPAIDSAITASDLAAVIPECLMGAK